MRGHTGRSSAFAPLTLLLGSIAAAGALVSCSPSPSNFRPTATLSEVMLSVVDPAAEELWESVATIVTDEGIEERTPSTDEEWITLRRHAITLLEASNLLLVPGRMVGRPGQKSEYPGIELDPEEVQALIENDPETYATLVNGLHDSAVAALEAIDAKNAQGLSDAGERIDIACESCHLQYWYPGQGPPSADEFPQIDPPDAETETVE